MGFRFTNNGTDRVNYGYVRIDTRTAVLTTGMPATIVGYAYDSSRACIVPVHAHRAGSATVGSCRME